MVMANSDGRWRCFLPSVLWFFLLSLSTSALCVQVSHFFFLQISFSLFFSIFFVSFFHFLHLSFVFLFHLLVSYVPYGITYGLGFYVFFFFVFFTHESIKERILYETPTCLLTNLMIYPQNKTLLPFAAKKNEKSTFHLRVPHWYFITYLKLE